MTTTTMTMLLSLPAWCGLQEQEAEVPAEILLQAMRPAVLSSSSSSLSSMMTMTTMINSEKLKLKEDSLSSLEMENFKEKWKQN